MIIFIGLILRLITGVILLYPLFCQVRGLLKHYRNGTGLAATRWVIFLVTLVLFLSNLVSISLQQSLIRGVKSDLLEESIFVNSVGYLVAALAFSWLYYKVHHDSD